MNLIIKYIGTNLNIRGFAVRRGGSFNNTGNNAVSYRNGNNATTWSNMNIGFRVVL